MTAMGIVVGGMGAASTEAGVEVEHKPDAEATEEEKRGLYTNGD